MADDGGLAEARSLAGRRGHIAWRLHPPTLRALGLRRKISIGGSAWPIVRLLAWLRFLRGTPLDPFGYAAVRRVEQRLAGQYRQAIDRVLGGLTADQWETAIGIANLPDEVRGYEDLKLARAAAYREEMAAALNGLVGR